MNNKLLNLILLINLPFLSFAYEKYNFDHFFNSLLSNIKFETISKYDHFFNSLVSNIKFETISEEVDFFRHFVFINSIHIVDSEHDSYAFNEKILLKKIISYYYNKTSLPHAACGPRANVLIEILKIRKIKARLVASFSSKHDQLNGHTFVEIYNPITKKWEYQDPDYDFYFALKNDQKTRLSTEDVVKLDTNDVCCYNFSGFPELFLEHELFIKIL